jgi:hypothetical protein
MPVWFLTLFLFLSLFLTLWASPFGRAESLAPPGAKDAAEPKGLAGAPGQPAPFSFGRATRMVSPSNSKMMA